MIAGRRGGDAATSPPRGSSLPACHQPFGTEEDSQRITRVHILPRLSSRVHTVVKMWSVFGRLRPQAGVRELRGD